MKTRWERVSPLSSHLCDENTMGEGFPPLVVSVCEENTTRRGFPPLVTSVCAVASVSARGKAQGSEMTSNALSGLQELTVSTFDKTQERSTFQLSRNIPAGSKAKLHIIFSGEITGSMMGHYKLSYEVDGRPNITLPLNSRYGT
jgi:hypothetical protein